jgi:hypothetical protein
MPRIQYRCSCAGTLVSGIFFLTLSAPQAAVVEIAK